MFVCLSFIYCHSLCIFIRSSFITIHLFSVIYFFIHFSVLLPFVIYFLTFGQLWNSWADLHHHVVNVMALNMCHDSTVTIDYNKAIRNILHNKYFRNEHYPSIKPHSRELGTSATRWFRWFWRVRPLQWRHNERDGVSNRRRLDCLLNRLFRRRSKKTSKLRVTGLCVRGIHRWPVDSPHKGPVTREMLPFDDVIMVFHDDNALLYGMTFLLMSWQLLTTKYFFRCCKRNLRCHRHCSLSTTTIQPKTVEKFETLLFPPAKIHSIHSPTPQWLLLSATYSGFRPKYVRA